MTRRKRLTKSQLSERRATRWSMAVMLVAMLGLLIAVLEPGGGLNQTRWLEAMRRLARYP